MDLSSAPRGRMCSCISPRSKRTGTARSTRARPWSLISSKAPRAFRLETSSAPSDKYPAIENPPDFVGRVFCWDFVDTHGLKPNKAVILGVLGLKWRANFQEVPFVERFLFTDNPAAPEGIQASVDPSLTRD